MENKNYSQFIAQFIMHFIDQNMSLATGVQCTVHHFFLCFFSPLCVSMSLSQRPTLYVLSAILILISMDVINN